MILSFIGGFFMIILVILIVAILFGYGAVSWGAVAYFFTNWFLIPILSSNFGLNSVEEITFIQGIGLFLFAAIFKEHNPNNSYKKDDDDSTTKAITAVLSPWVLLGLGYLFKLFFM